MINAKREALMLGGVLNGLQTRLVETRERTLYSRFIKPSFSDNEPPMVSISDVSIPFSPAACNLVSFVRKIGPSLASTEL